MDDESLFLKITTTACKGTDTEVNYLEHVQAVISANASRRGDLEMFLTSPMGTRSMILSKRANDDDHRDGFTKWPFMTTHTWGEYPQGTWILEVCRYFSSLNMNFHPVNFIHALHTNKLEFTGCLNHCYCSFRFVSILINHKLDGLKSGR